MTKPKQVSNEDQAEKPLLTVEDSVAPMAEPAKPQKTVTSEVNGIIMTFEDY